MEVNTNEVNGMPLGCIHSFIVIKRSAILLALQKTEANCDQQRVAYASSLLTSQHADTFLVALESMDDSRYDLNNLQYLGLIGSNGSDWVDFFAPHLAQHSVSWLCYAPIREIKPNGCLGQVVWHGYRHIDDVSTTVTVWENDEFPAKPREPFPDINCLQD